MSTCLCAIARDANSYITGWLGRQPKLGEEVITAWLLDYFEQKSSKVRYYAFNKIEEGTVSGADWDWWFLLKKGCFKVRVQAKKVKEPNADNYGDLARQNRMGFQIDLLLESSCKLNFYPISLPSQRYSSKNSCFGPSESSSTA